MLLVFRAHKRKVSTKKVALGLGLHPDYLPYLYKQSKLTMEVIKAASEFFNVSPKLFEDEVGDEVQAMMNELRILRAELNETKRDLTRANTRIKTLEDDAVLRDAREIRRSRKKKASSDDETSRN